MHVYRLLIRSECALPIAMYLPTLDNSNKTLFSKYFPQSKPKNSSSATIIQADSSEVQCSELLHLPAALLSILFVVWLRARPVLSHRQPCYQFLQSSSPAARLLLPRRPSGPVLVLQLVSRLNSATSPPVHSRLSYLPLHCFLKLLTTRLYIFLIG